MRNLLPTGAVAGLVVAASAALASGVPPALEEKDETLGIGDTVPATIALTDIDGNEHAFADLRGKTVVLDFWSIDCPWSQKYEERFKELYADLEEDEDVTLLAIDSNHTEIAEGADDPYRRIRAYVKENEVPYPILIDRDNVFADLLEAKTTPHVYVLDGEGVIRYQGALDDNADPKKVKKTYVRDVLGALEAGEELPWTETRPFGCTIKRKKST